VSLCSRDFALNSAEDEPTGLLCLPAFSTSLASTPGLTVISLGTPLTTTVGETFDLADSDALVPLEGSLRTEELEEFSATVAALLSDPFLSVRKDTDALRWDSSRREEVAAAVATRRGVTSEETGGLGGPLAEDITPSTLLLALDGLEVVSLTEACRVMRGGGESTV